jgi:uncharacterized hydrophobic protein (TIGR00271 family)
MAYEHEFAETFHRLQDDVEVSAYYTTLMGLSGVLAAVGMLTNSVPVLIGAMLVAPAFPPLALLAMGLVLGRWALARRSFTVSMAGLAISIVCAMLTTWVLNITGAIPEGSNLFQREMLEERVRPGWYSIAAALAAGIAAMLAAIRSKMDALIGTLAAVALVPAGAAAGIAFISGDATRGLGGLILLAMNVILIVAMGMAVLLALGRGRRSTTAIK